MNACKLLVSLVVVLPAFACGDGADAPLSSGADGGDAIVTADADNVGPTEICSATRMIVLGDSITACFGVGQADAATCGPKIFHNYLATKIPGIVYENIAVSGAKTASMPDAQLARATKGAGHVIALAYAGGNDLQPLIIQSDEGAMTSYASLLPRIQQSWQEVFDFFGSEVNFPDGATLIINNQYNPFDDCSATGAGFSISAAKIELLTNYNKELADLANANDHVFITDQHGPYLGHGNNYAEPSCASYSADAVPFMNDLIHPNEAGHANLADQWQKTAETLLSNCP